MSSFIGVSWVMESLHSNVTVTKTSRHGFKDNHLGEKGTFHSGKVVSSYQGTIVILNILDT